MSDSLTGRRLVLHRRGQGGLLLGASAGLGVLGLYCPGRFRREGKARALRDPRVGDEPGRPPLVVARGVDPATLVRAALGALGGAARFLRRGETVLVKPNMAGDRSPEQGANNPPRRGRGGGPPVP